MYFYLCCTVVLRLRYWCVERTSRNNFEIVVAEQKKYVTVVVFSNCLDPFSCLFIASPNFKLRFFFQTTKVTADKQRHQPQP